MQPAQYSECLLSRLNAYCTFETVPLCGAFFLSKVRNHREIRKRNEKKNGDVFSPICGFPLSIKTINNFMSIVKNFRYQTYMIEGSFHHFITFKSGKTPLFGTRAQATVKHGLIGTLLLKMNRNKVVFAKTTCTYFHLFFAARTFLLKIENPAHF